MQAIGLQLLKNLAHFNLKLIAANLNLPLSKKSAKAETPMRFFH
jgi:hypothetical protein